MHDVHTHTNTHANKHTRGLRHRAVEDVVWPVVDPDDDPEDWCSVCVCACVVCVVSSAGSGHAPTSLLIGLYELRVSDLQEEALVLLVFFVINYPDFYCFAGEREGERKRRRGRKE